MNRRQLNRGQTLAIFALALPALMAVMALGIDGGNVFVQYRSAQSAADMAALAGANVLPHQPTAADYTAARNRAFALANANGYASGNVTVNAPYVDEDNQTHPHQVEVLIREPVPTYFLRVVGAATMDVDVRGLAGSEWTIESSSIVAIYAHCGSSSSGTSCPDQNKAILWGGSDNTVVGGVHSNCGWEMSGSNNDITGPSTAVCTPTGSGSGNTYDPNYGGTRTLTTRRDPFPLNYTWDTFCHAGAPNVVTRRTSGKLELKNFYQSTSGGINTLQPGVYCSSGSSAEIELGDGHVHGNVTLVTTGRIKIGGSDFNLTAFHPTKVLMWANGTGDSVIGISGSDGTWHGMIVAPRGEVEISGSSNNTTGGGAVLADRVKLNGSILTIDSRGLDTLGDPSRDYLRLWE